jgi:REP element-mobilizing transposase RayT
MFAFALGMGRPARPVAPSTLYHVTARCNNSDFFLKSGDDFRLFLTTLHHYKKKLNFKLFAYCLLNSHIHLLIQTPKQNLSENPENADDEDHSISKIMHDILWRFAFTYNRLHDRKGHFFNDRFKSPVVEADSYGITLLRYIAQNPVRAGMVKNARDWKWSSYRYYSEGEFDAVVDPLPSFLGMNAKRLVRARMIRELVETAVMKQDTSWSRNYAIGTEGFIKKVKKEFLGQAPPG